MHTLSHIVGGLYTIIMAIVIWFLLGSAPGGWFGDKNWILYRIIAVLSLLTGLYLLATPFFPEIMGVFE